MIPSQQSPKKSESCLFPVLFPARGFRVGSPHSWLAVRQSYLVAPSTLLSIMGEVGRDGLGYWVIIGFGGMMGDADGSPRSQGLGLGLGRYFSVVLDTVPHYLHVADYFTLRSRYLSSGVK